MRKITVAITVDDKIGLAFNRRRQSRDRHLIEDLIKSTTGQIYITGYSESLFIDFKDRICVVDNPMTECPNDGVCFIELTDIGEHLDCIDKLIIYHWNRHYPSDKQLTVDLDGGMFKRDSVYDFIGSSHEKITKEIYVKA